MNYEEYRKKYFQDPVPPERFELHGVLGATLYYGDYPAALAFITQIFGEPVYQEGEFTRGWRLGRSWLTVFPAKRGNPSNADIPVYLSSAEELDRLYAAFIEAGASGDPPEDTLMYEPVRMAILTDPFGVDWNLVAPL